MTEYQERRLLLTFSRCKSAADTVTNQGDKVESLVSSKPYWKECMPINIDEPEFIVHVVKVAKTPAEWLVRRR